MNKKILSFIKKNKVKAGFIGFGIFLVLILILNGLVAIIGNNSMKPDMLSFGQESSTTDMEMSSFSTNTVGRSMSKMNIMSIPNFENEGKYDESIERKIIKTGNLSLEVQNIENAKNNISEIVKRYKGFIQSSNFSEVERYNHNDFRSENRISPPISKSGNFTLKIPSANFDKAFEELKLVALRVSNESVSRSDVTEQFADLETQLKNKKAEVDQFRKILERAIKIEDVLKTTQYLNSAQNQFERLQGRMNRLSNQITMSTIRVNIISEKEFEVFGITWSPLSEFKNGFSNMVEDLKDFADGVIAFMFKLPIYILYFAVFILSISTAWKIVKVLKKRFKSKK